MIDAGLCYDTKTAMQTLTGTSRRGNKYLRKLFGARSAFGAAAENETNFSSEYVAGQSGITQAPSVATVALANKMARMT